MTRRARILDADFKYVPASKTDIRATFRRVMREQAREAEAAKQAANVKPIRKVAK